MAREKGLTFIDLVVAIAIFSVLLGLGIPSFRSFMFKQNSDASVRQVFRHLQKARELAVLSGNEMIFCGIDEEQKCIRENATRFVIFFDANKNGRVDEGEAVESELNSRYPGQIHTNIPKSFFRFFPNGATRPSGSIIFCPANHDPKLVRRVSTNLSGRPYIARPNAAGFVVDSSRNPIRCDE